jgi:hypothetical protein
MTDNRGNKIIGKGSKEGIFLLAVSLFLLLPEKMSPRELA